MADYLVTDTELTSIANAIRSKGGTSGTLSFPSGFVSAINNISTSVNAGYILSPIDDLGIQSGKYIDTDGSEVTYSTWSATDYLEVSGDTIVFYIGSNSGGNYSAFYDVNHTFISSFSYTVGKMQVTVPTGAKYFRLSFSNDQLNNISAYKWVPDPFTGAIVEDNDVMFYDYDGTALYSYSASDFLQLTSMPNAPSHTGLACQGWNWTLTQAQNFVMQYGVADIGAMYETDDGKSRFYIHIANNLLLTTTIYWHQSITNGVIVDWGDGSNTITVSGTDNVSASHTYPAPGYYTITMERASSGVVLYFGTNSEGTCSFMGPVGMANSPELCKLEKAEIGSLNNYSLGKGAFEDCFHLETITIPNGYITTLNNSTFRGTQCLKHITIPANLNIISDSVFITNIDWEGYSCALQSISFPPICYIGYSSIYALVNIKRIIYPQPDSTHKSLNGWQIASCHSLTQIIIPEGYEYFGESFFHFDLALTQITLPSTINTIADNSIKQCNNLKELHLKPTTPPTLQGTLPIPSTCTIYVPQSTGHTILDAYKAATNWSTLASQMQEEP